MSVLSTGNESNVNMEKQPWEDTFWSEERRGEVVKKLSENRGNRKRSKQSMFDACSSRKRSSRDTLFTQLEYRTFLSRNNRFGGVDVAKKNNNIEVVQKILLQKAKDKDDVDRLCQRMLACSRRP